MSKKLAKYQLGIVIGTLILTVLYWIIVGHGSMTFNFSAAGGFIALIALIFAIASLVIGIMQIIHGAKESCGLGLAAGIVGIIAFLPFVGIAVWTAYIIAISALVLNILVYFKK